MATNLPRETAADKPAPLRLLVSANSANAEWLSTCPSATTLFGISATLESYVVCALTCKRWACCYCGRRKISRLAALTREAVPNRLITLTVNPACHLDPRAAFDSTRRKVSDFAKLMRKSVGEFEFLRVLEVTKKGWPHYHFVCRCPYVPQATISDLWAKLTGAPIVDVRAIDRTSSAYWYVVKYLSKQQYIPWTSRRVSWSRKFFTPADKSKNVRLKIWNRDRFQVHPAEFIDRELRGQTLEVVTPGCWRVVWEDGKDDVDGYAITRHEIDHRRRQKKS